MVDLVVFNHSKFLTPEEAGDVAGDLTHVVALDRPFEAAQQPFAFDRGVGPAKADGDRAVFADAPDSEGALHYVGRVGSGLGEQTRAQLLAAMRPLHADRPLVDPKGEEGIWLEPRLFCEVKFLEWTDSGVLRSPVFVDWFVAE